jgi:hypothetical protein
VRHLTALLLIAVFAVAVSADGMCCPDGCTRESSRAASASDGHAATDGACVFCQGGAVSPHAAPLLPIGALTASPTLVPTSPTIDGVAGAADHPPRS